MDFKFNANEMVKVKLSEEGIRILSEKRDHLNEVIQSRGGQGFGAYVPRVDEDGYTKYQLWALIQDFGPHVGLLKPNVFDLDMIFVNGKPIEKEC